MLKDALTALGLTDEQAEKVLGLHTEALNDYVPKEKLAEAETEKGQLEKSLNERDEQLLGLQTAAGDNEELKRQLAEAIAKNEETGRQAAAELAAYKTDKAVEMQLIKLGAKNHTAVKALIDMNKVKLDGEILLGFSEQIEAIKTSDPYLFGSVLSGREPGAGNGNNTPPDGLKENPFKKETWNLTKQGDLLRDNPYLYHKMKAAAGQ